MAITCTGPPPLPPGKRFIQRASARKQVAVGPTYRSFRDPSLEAWIPASQRIATRRGLPTDNGDEPKDDDFDDIDGFDLSGIKLCCDEPIIRLD